ncbi:hypothetical protein [Rhodococcus sp. Q]|nr:hypothetical protein [Rhodococcus sp. Q]
MSCSPERRMILVDTVVWIGHLHSTEAQLVDLFALDRVGCLVW